jgi:twinkle protein
MIIDHDKVMEAKEILGDRNATLMAEMLQLEDYDENNMKALCCFHHEDTPSLIYNPKNYTFHCFGCQKTVDILDVYMQTQHLTYIEAVQKLFEEAGIHYSFGEANVRTRHQYIYPQEVSKDNDMTQVYEYMASRGISKETVDYLDIRSDGEGNMVYNYYDTNDVLTNVKYRPARKVRKGTNKCWAQKGADTTPLLYNINRINTGESITIVEGENDLAALIESGIHNAVSVPFGAGNFSWIQENWDWLEQFDNIIICSDNDEPGIKMQKECVYRLGSWRTKVVDIPQTVTSQFTGRKVAVKDINEVLYYCGKEAVVNLIANAKDTPVPSLIDFADVKEIDLSDIEGITVGINDIDKEIMRLFYSSLTILSGTPGSGKTSFLCQLAAQSIDQDKPVWMFSREMPDWLTKNWIEYILAGNRHITQFQSNSGAAYWKVNEDAKREISRHYREQLMIYRDQFSNKLQDLQTSMEDSARKYGSKLFIIDNLMTVDLDATSESMNEKQTEFVQWLIQFAMKYNVATVLVCHPRKLQPGVTNVGMYDISGTSNIINLAHRAFGLKRVTKAEKEGVRKLDNSGWKVKPVKYDVRFEIIKDRLRGKSNLEVGLYYDVPSRRFFTTPEEYEHQYLWDKNVYKDHLPYPITNDSEVFG